MDLIGKTLGNYRIDRLLGEGGMGAVYQAYDLSLQRDVAIKLIHPHFARRADFRERFLQEARIMARLDHPGIVKVFSLGKEGDLLYLPMEFIKGGNLRQLLDRLLQERKWLPLNEAVLLIKQVCQTVDYAHRHGVLHRDIKPANLMLKPEPTDGLPFRVVLTDLGLAKLVEGLGLTQEGTSLGTPAYMSPEQASGRDTDPRSDVYSLGVLLFELAVGRLPFLIRTITEAIRYHTQEPAPAPRSIRPELPEALERVILKALEKEPTDRYSSAGEMAVALSETMSSTTQVTELVTGHDTSLITEYDHSLVGPALQATSLMTVFDGPSLPPRGESVFGGQSVPPSPDTRIQVVYKESTAQVFPLASGTATIGRASHNSIPLSDPKASQRHAQVTWDGMEYHVMDLNSTNGTYLGNTKLLPGIPEIWRANQNLRIGDTWLRLLRPTPGARPESAMGSRPGGSHYMSSEAGLVGISVAPQQPSVEPGESVTITLSLLNQSPNVDHFSISLSGIPSSWITSLPPSVQLMPGEQKDTAFTILVPRTPQGRAGKHPITLRVTSQRDSGQFVEIKLTLTVAPYSQFKAELQPQRLQPKQPGRLTISNQGNSLESFSVQLLDSAGELTFEPSQPQTQVGPGETALVLFHPKVSQQRWIGGEKLHPFTAKVMSLTAGAQTLQGDMISRGLIPVWVLPTVLLLCLVCIGAALPFLPGPFTSTTETPTWTVPSPLVTPASSNTPTTPTLSPSSTTETSVTVTSSPITLTPTNTSVSSTLTLTLTLTPSFTPSLTPTLTPSVTTIPTQTPMPLVSGHLDIPQTWPVDLDNGVLINDLGAADIWFHAVTHTERYLERANSAQIVIAGLSPPGLSGCMSKTFTTDRINVNDLSPGMYICVLTDAHHYSQLLVTAPVGPSPGVLSIDFITW